MPMLVNILEENKDGELIFSVELPNERAKKYIKKIFKDYEEDILEDSDLEMFLLDEFKEEWIEEARKRVNHNLIDGLYRIRNFKALGKGNPIYFECVSFLKKPLLEKHYKGFELDFTPPELHPEAYLARVDDIFYKLKELELSYEKVEMLDKVKLDLTVIDKDTGKEIEDLSEEFFDFIDSMSFPDLILRKITEHKAGETFEVELKIDESIDDYYLEDEYFGQTLIYKIKIRQVYKEILPERPYSDELAQKLGYKNLEAVINEAKKTQASLHARFYKHELIRQYLRKVAENLEFKVTENMIFVNKLELNLIDANGKSLLPETMANPDEDMKDIILEEILLSDIYIAEGMSIDGDKLLDRVLAEASVDEDLDDEEVSERVLELALEEMRKWLDTNLGKFITINCP